jgi:glycosyltransferase involved in cell wall biosynthesis
MRIAYLSTFYPYRGGIAQFNGSLYRAFERRNDVEIQAYTYSRQYPGFLFPGTSQVVAEDDPADPVPALRILDTVNPLSYYKTAREILDFKPDLLLMKFFMPYFGLSVGSVARLLHKRGIKTISLLGNVIPHEERPGDMALSKFFFRQNDAFITLSKAMQADLLSLKPGARFLYHPHPIYSHFGTPSRKLEARKRLNIPPDKKVMIFFGFIRKYKGLDIALEAMQYLPKDYYLIIAGEVYGGFDEYQQLIDKYNLADRVQLHVRYVSDNEVPDFFCASDICVLPYRSATQSGVIPIAYHFEIPVVVTDVGGLREVVEPFNTGVVAPNTSPATVADAVQECFNRNQVENLSGNIHLFKQKYSWDNLAETVLEMYRQLQ